MSGPSAPGPASAMVYTIDANLPAGMVRLSEQRPHCDRVPDELDARPVRIGTAVFGALVNGQVQWHFRELPDYAACGGQPAMGGGLMRDPVTGQIIIQPPPPPPPTGSLSPSGLPPPMAEP